MKTAAVLFVQDPTALVEWSKRHDKANKNRPRAGRRGVRDLHFEYSDGGETNYLAQPLPEIRFIRIFERARAPRLGVRSLVTIRARNAHGSNMLFGNPAQYAQHRAQIELERETEEHEQSSRSRSASRSSAPWSRQSAREDDEKNKTAKGDMLGWESSGQLYGYPLPSSRQGSRSCDEDKSQDMMRKQRNEFNKLLKGREQSEAARRNLAKARQRDERDERDIERREEEALRQQHERQRRTLPPPTQGFASPKGSPPTRSPAFARSSPSDVSPRTPSRSSPSPRRAPSPRCNSPRALQRCVSTTSSASASSGASSGGFRFSSGGTSSNTGSSPRQAVRSGSPRTYDRTNYSPRQSSLRRAAPSHGASPLPSAGALQASHSEPVLRKTRDHNMYMSAALHPRPPPLSGAAGANTVVNTAGRNRASNVADVKRIGTPHPAAQRGPPLSRPEGSNIYHLEDQPAEECWLAEHHAPWLTSDPIPHFFDGGGSGSSRLSSIAESASIKGGASISSVADSVAESVATTASIGSRVSVRSDRSVGIG